MKFMLLAVAGAMLLPAAASAQSMNAQRFYTRANQLQKKGMMAIFSSDVKQMMNEGKSAADASRNQRLAAIKAGRKPRYCPPEGPQKMSTEEFMKRLGAIPAAERSRIDMTEAMTRILIVKFPCR